MDERGQLEEFGAIALGVVLAIVAFSTPWPINLAFGFGAAVALVGGFIKLVRS